MSFFNFEERAAASPLVETIWRNRPETGGSFISVATSRWEMVVTYSQGQQRLTLRGPETRATPAYCPPDTEHFGIQFAPGAVLSLFPAARLRDGLVDLPQAGSASFWLDSSAWEYPHYDNADVFVDRLARAGLLVREPLIDSALGTVAPDVSARTIQRRFLQATGLTRGALGQIERARASAQLLRQGVSILDTVEQAGYADQPHLTRSLRYFIGLTPAQLLPPREIPQLSFFTRPRLSEA